MAKRTGILAARTTTELTTQPGKSQMKAKEDVVKGAAAPANPGSAGRPGQARAAAPRASATPDRDGQPTVEEAIRLGAYLKWEAAGMPGGDGVKFWLEAEKEIRGKH